MESYKSTYNSSMPTLSRFINCPFRYSCVADKGLNRESNSRFKMEDRNELIEHYFNLGYQQKEILSCLLLIHDQNLSSRQLKRILARCNQTLTQQPTTCKLHPLLQKTLKNFLLLISQIKVMFSEFKFKFQVSWWWSLCVSMTLRAVPAGTVVPGRSNHAGLVEG